MSLKKVAVLAGSAALGVFASKKLLKQDFCPKCAVNKIIASAKVQPLEKELYNNGVALTPPMGWSSWNTFRHTIDESLIKEIAVAMKKTGLADAGYQYINLDDCWQSSLRTADGKLQGDLTRFPRGIKPLIEDLNKDGFKVGLYTSNGTLTCEDLPASLYNEKVDADTLAEWGVEYFKYDFCHNEIIPSVAPSVDKICVGTKAGHDFIEIEAEHGTLLGNAKVFKDENFKSGFVVGSLCANNGALVFDTIDVPEDDEYVLTIVFKKGGLQKKFLVCTVNDKDEYDCYFPSSKGFTPDGRHQVIVKLNKGLNTTKLSNPVGSRMDSAARQYTNMGQELKRATREYAEKNNVPEKPICYSICEWGMNQPWKWGAKAGNLWRTTMDIKPNYPSLLYCYELNVRLYKNAVIGGWNDPDMLEVGVGSLTMEENKSHFTLWCMMAAPLILGNDVRKFLKEDGTVDTENKVLEILTNKNLIAIDQDKLGKQAKRIFTDGISDILVKPLENNEIAVCFFNKGNTQKNMSITLNKLHNDIYVNLPIVDTYKAINLWSNEAFTVTKDIFASVPPHGVKVFRIKSEKTVD
ncbi:MAG: alpha-galactosidase [Clostridia bacterium]|nr:alpha-galactosidase [Clostridia bacterium]